MGKICYSETNALKVMLDGKSKYVVPNYQRAYNWTGDKVDELWDDLIDNHASSSNNPYLLGPIMIVKKAGVSGPYEIVDGQQRLVTLTLMFCALRNSLNKHEPDESDDRDDHKELIKEINESIKDSSGSLIKLNDESNDVFTDICVKDDSRELEEGLNQASKKQIVINYKILLKYTNSLCEKYFDADNDRGAIRKIRKLTNAIKDNTYFVYIQIHEEEYSYQVFQSLNSKGQKLNQSDLVKSHLLSISGEDVKTKWDKIISLKSIKKNPDDFLYYSMLSRKCPSSGDGADEILKMKIYNIVKKEINTKEKVRTYLKELSEDSKIIDKLNEHSDSDEEFRHILYGITQVGAKYFRRSIITAYREWGDTKDSKILIECLLKFFFMYRTISKLDIDQIKRIARDTTCHILNKKNLNEVLYTILKSEKLGVEVDNIDQKEFMDEFKNNIDNLRPSVATYILYSIERKIHEEQGVHVRPIPNRYQLEHIFPQNPNKEWDNKDVLKNHKNRLGNLTLLDMKWNSTLKNRSFEDKMNKGDKCYSKSGVELNKRYLTTYAKWDVEEIEDREKKLIEYASKIWDLSEYSKRAQKPRD